MPIVSIVVHGLWFISSRRLTDGILFSPSVLCGKWETSPREFAKCRRCRKAKYCGKKCQSRAWSEGHRFWCSVREGDEAEPSNHGHGTNRHFHGAASTTGDTTGGADGGADTDPAIGPSGEVGLREAALAARQQRREERERQRQQMTVAAAAAMNIPVERVANVLRQRGELLNHPPPHAPAPLLRDEDPEGRVRARAIEQLFRRPPNAEGSGSEEVADGQERTMMRRSTSFVNLHRHSWSMEGNRQQGRMREAMADVMGTTPAGESSTGTGYGSSSIINNAINPQTHAHALAQSNTNIGRQSPGVIGDRQWRTIAIPNMSQPAANVSLAPLRPHQQRTQQYLAFSPYSANAMPFAPFGQDMSPGQGGHSGHVNVDEDADIDVDVDADVADVEVDVDFVDAGLANLRRQNERSRADDDLEM